MKKRTVFICVLLSLALSLFGCDSGAGTKEPPDNSGTTPEPSEAKELLFDTSFSEGVSVTGLNSQEVTRTTWKYGDSNAAQEPFWTLGQYCDLSATRAGYDSSRNDLSLGTIFEDPKGITGTDGDFFTLTNVSGSKEIKVNPLTGAVKLNVDTRKEYCEQSTGEIVPRKNGEDWVHMILQPAQGIKDVVWLSKTESFALSLDFTLDACNVLDSSIGADQFQWIFTVHDEKSEIGEYFWFLVTLFDNRYEIFPGTQAFDSGKDDATGQFMYAPTGTELFGETGGKVEVGKKYSVSLNLKEHMKKAFEIAQSKGALKNSKWEDLTVKNFNIGWEVSNVSQAGVTIENMSLTAKTAA